MAEHSTASKAKGKNLGGRPKGEKNKIAMSFRFRREFPKVLKSICKLKNLNQGRLIEEAVFRYAKSASGLL